MKRVTIIILLLNWICCPMKAQIDTLVWFEGVILRPGDFKSTSPIEYFDISTEHSYHIEPVGLKGYQPLIKSLTYFNRTTSAWSGSPESLRYAQLLFDLHGYQARLTTSRVLKLGLLPSDIPTAKKILDECVFKTDQEMAVIKSTIRQEMLSDDPGQALEKWEKRVHDWLKELPEMNIEVRESFTDWQIGMFLGGGSAFFSGKTAEYFSHASGIDFGCEFDKNKSRFTLDALLAFNSSRQSLHHKGDWPADLKTTLANIELVYGHRFQRKNILWVPQIGLAVNEFTPRKSDPDDGRKLTGYSPVLGLEFNYLFRRIDYEQERTTLFYKCRLSVSPSNLMRAYAAPQFNLRMSFGFDTALKRRRLVAVAD